MTSVISPVRSISDLARIAGVSVSTVSRALTGKGTLNQSTRDRIRAIADDHGFRGGTKPAAGTDRGGGRVVAAGP